MPNPDSSPEEGILDGILGRRSLNGYTDEGPTAEELDVILQAAVSVPDHGGLQPWRLVIIEGDARGAFGDALAAAGRVADPNMDDIRGDRLRSKAFAAPTIVAVCARIAPSPKIPEWEQFASAACAGYAITLAAHQLGLGAMWKSTPFVEAPELSQVLDMSPRDRFLGWVNIGRLAPGRIVGPRDPVNLGDIARVLTADGTPVTYSR